MHTGWDSPRLWNCYSVIDDGPPNEGFPLFVCVLVICVLYMLYHSMYCVLVNVYIQCVAYCVGVVRGF